MEKGEKEKTIWDLKIHEGLEIKTEFGGKAEILRVGSGWLYAMEYPGWRQTQVVFVPWIAEGNPEKSITNNKK